MEKGRTVYIIMKLWVCCDLDVKKDISAPACRVDVFSSYAAESKALYHALLDFEEMRRRRMRPLTDRGRKLLIARLNSLAQTDEGRVQLLEESILNGWSSVYPLRASIPRAGCLDDILLQ